MSEKQGATANFFWGVLATVIAGLVLWWLQDYLKSSAELSWSTVAQYRLPEKYSYEGVEAQSFESVLARQQTAIAITNTGGQAAPNVSVLIRSEPLGLSVDPVSETKVQKVGENLYVVKLGAVASESQTVLYFSGVSFGDIERVEFQSDVVEWDSGPMLLPWDGSWFVTIEFLIMIGLLVVSLVAFAVLIFSGKLEEASKRELKKNLIELGVPLSENTAKEEKQ